MAAELGIVTVTYNSAKVLAPFLECVRRQTTRDFVLVVMDNASTDETLKVLEAHRDDNVRLLANSKNTGIAEGNNQGIALCRELGVKWVLLINNDTEFPDDLFEKMIASAERLSTRVLVPRITYYDRPDLNWFAGGHFSWRRGLQGRHETVVAPFEGSTTAPRNISCATTCCMLIRTDVFDQVGLMDEAYFVYWDDTDFCWRLNRHGVQISFDPSLTMKHKVGSLTGGELSPFAEHHYNRNQVYFLRKHFSPLVVRANVAVVRLKNLARRALRMDDAKMARIRRTAIAEGLKMPIRPRDAATGA